MNILILTSKDHPYAHALLNGLLNRNALAGDTVTICEQKGLIPGKLFVAGLVRYLRISGMHYVVAQACKLYLFQWARLAALLRNRTDSPWYPYHKRTNWKRCAGTASACIAAVQPDVILSLFSKEILTAEDLRTPKMGVLNLHPAFLPDYRGISPTFWVMADGKTQTGCTLHMIDAGIDTGGIVDQKNISVEGVRTEHALYMCCLQAGIAMLAEALEQLRAGSAISVRLQEGAGCYRSLPTKEAVRRFVNRGYRFFLLKEFHNDSTAMR
ncbi:MAG: formyltransferase family protein [bacterium]|nr:formyltransferase family protein [bacterium]